MDLRTRSDRSRAARSRTVSRRERARLGPLQRAGIARGEAGGAVTTGQDLSAPAPRRERRRWLQGGGLAGAAGLLVAALVLVQLRTESIDLRYRLARALQSEQQLLEQQRRLIVELRQMRHPLRLAALGGELGLVRPTEIRELPAASALP